jgi:hypothetical protein
MLANIAHHQPVALEGRHCRRTLAILGDVLDKMKMPPGRRREVAGIVVLVPRSPRSSAGSAFHSLQATSQALQPMHNVVSVKNP